MNVNQLETLLAPYNPWWNPDSKWEAALPDYQRPIVAEVLSDLHDLQQVISVTGPRRVGKSTAVKHVILRLIKDQDIAPKHILYFSFDDPEVFASQEMQRVIFDHLVARTKDAEQPHYYFLDEIQRLPRWELFIKKYYDLRVPVRFIVTGSASSPIFRQSQESLLGRIKDRHLLPFSFSEYSQYRLKHKPEFAQILNEHRRLRAALLDGDGQAALSCVSQLHAALVPFDQDITDAVMSYFSEGGFPEVWALPDTARKIEYLMEQQIRKVLYEDLMMLTQYRKPENVLRFFIYLLAHPGQEVNTGKIASDAGVARRVVEENLPRLVMTDLIIRIRKFSHQPLRVRQGNIKCYPVDMALRNAVLKTWSSFDATTIGYFAENAVAREIVAWPENIEISYFREKNREVDFIVTHGGNRYLPLEVKHRNRAEQATNLKSFMKKYKIPFGVVITKERSPALEDVLYIPLRYFLLAT